MPASILPFAHLTVIGFGLIGGSFAMAARQVMPGLQIHAIDPNGETLQYALRHRLADTVSLELPQHFESQPLRGHLILLACHLSQSVQVLEALAPRIAGQQAVWVTDVGSCKQAIVLLGDRLLPGQFLGGHPMAGKEFSGLQQATELLFSHKTYMFCPTPHTNPALLEALQTLVRQFGAVPASLPADFHDRAMAAMSHFPQLYSVLLAAMLSKHEPEKLLPLSGAGIDGQLRLAASPFAMWGDVLQHNRQAVLAIVKDFQAILNQAEALFASDEDLTLAAGLLAQWFQQSNAVHQTFHALRQKL